MHAMITLAVPFIAIIVGLAALLGFWALTRSWKRDISGNDGDTLAGHSPDLAWAHAPAAGSASPGASECRTAEMVETASSRASCDTSSSSDTGSSD
jgi:hypothetical protein